MNSLEEEIPLSARTSLEYIGGGLYRLKEIALPSDLNDWCCAPEARRILGHGFTRSLYPLMGEYLVFRRPLRMKVEFHRASVLALRDAIETNRFFWTDKAARAVVRAEVEIQMRKLVESSLQRKCNS